MQQGKVTVDGKITPFSRDDIQQSITHLQEYYTSNLNELNGTQKVELYDVKHPTTPTLYWLESKNHVAAVFAGSNRNQLGILRINGDITLHSTEPQ